jgi:hypothetical protein
MRDFTSSSEIKDFSPTISDMTHNFEMYPGWTQFNPYHLDEWGEVILLDVPALIESFKKPDSMSVPLDDGEVHCQLRKLQEEKRRGKELKLGVAEAKSSLSVSAETASDISSLKSSGDTRRVASPARDVALSNALAPNAILTPSGAIKYGSHKMFLKGKKGSYTLLMAKNVKGATHVCELAPGDRIDISYDIKHVKTSEDRFKCEKVLEEVHSILTASIF